MADEVGPPPMGEGLLAWRRATRDTLIAARLALPPAALEAYRERIDRHIESGFADLGQGVFGFCWPYQNEYDARFLARRLRQSGAVTALPVVVAPRQPLVFRAWRPGITLARGVYDIPYPEAGPSIEPTTVLVPMNAFDEAGYRLGYGGGFFDRTLAALAVRPRVIGVAYELARIPTIHPQPWDIPMDFVVTEDAVYERRDEQLVALDSNHPGRSAATPP
jgi:5-formyltetrahydrofolate cyclo-ligase